VVIVYGEKRRKIYPSEKYQFEFKARVHGGGHKVDKNGNYDYLVVIF
jgi:hypothetical protein